MSLIQAIIVLILTFIICAVFTGIEIPILRSHQLGQNIREEGPQSHLAKAGTPSMGGVAIVLAISLVSLVCAAIMGAFGPAILVMVVFMLLYALIGFLDDDLKVIHKDNLGLRAWQKIVFQLVISIAMALYMYFFGDGGSNVYIPFAGTYVDFGFWYVPFVVFVLIAMTNSVNLTDGLDGLASGTTVFVAIFFATCCAADVYNGKPAGIFSMAIAGACLGFLVFNKNPAKVFMGDTGSLGLGGAIGAAAIVMKCELFLPIAGLIYVLEALSVIIQVVSFKSTGKRVFRMAPLHHHFEEGGMKEVSVVYMFWAGSFLFSALAFLIFHI